jgi:class 3 adenylate cyclase
MSGVFLQETEATICVFDLRSFSRLAVTLAPLDLGLALGHYYGHTEDCVLRHHGRIVKFAGDLVLAAWLDNEVGEHQSKALAAIGDVLAHKSEWLARNQSQGLPVLDYSLAAATGPVLAGHIGTDRFRAFDVLGEPVGVASKLTVVATMRQIDHLVAFPAPGGVEVEAMEIGGKLVRLFRLTGPA